ncbi:MAG: chorismate--pyruvate lyase family protein [Pseudomonadota bacterium]
MNTETRLPRWRPAAVVVRNLPLSLTPFLLETGSLTRRMERACGEPLQVRVLEQSWRRPRADEVRALALAEGRWGLVRCVRLSCGADSWVYARSVIPPETLGGRLRRLAHLGERPLGAALFAEPAMSRGPLELARLEPGMALHTDAGGGEGVRWARRSVFRLAGAPLLVCEVFNEVNP